jgi:hypothetical protein
MLRVRADRSAVIAYEIILGCLLGKADAWNEKVVS